MGIVSELPENEAQRVIYLVSNVQEEILASARQSNGENTSALYLAGILSLSLSLAELPESDQKIEHLFDGLSSWRTLLKSCGSLETLQGCGVNTDLMVEKLSLLVDFLDMKGFSNVRKETLELLFQLYKILDVPTDGENIFCWK